MVCGIVSGLSRGEWLCFPWRGPLPGSGWVGMWRSLAPAQSRGDERQKGRLPIGWVLEVVGQVGVERDAVALAEIMALPVADQDERSPLDECRLTAAGLVHGRVVRRARRAS